MIQTPFPVYDGIPFIRPLTVVVSTTSMLRQEDYGDITGGLTNGLKFFASFRGTGGAEIQLLAAQDIKTNNDFQVIKLLPD